MQKGLNPFVYTVLPSLIVMPLLTLFFLFLGEKLEEGEYNKPEKISVYNKDNSYIEAYVIFRDNVSKQFIVDNSGMKCKIYPDFYRDNLKEKLNSKNSWSEENNSNNFSFGDKIYTVGGYFEDKKILGIARSVEFRDINCDNQELNEKIKKSEMGFDGPLMANIKFIKYETGVVLLDDNDFWKKYEENHQNNINFRIE